MCVDYVCSHPCVGIAKGYQLRRLTRLQHLEYLDRCWPFALQDDMLFDTTLAASRAAWCLAQRRLPGYDHFLLCHNATALSKLRQRISSKVVAPDESIVFTMGYMLNVAYMMKERSAFSIH
jgi:hypothetical protein